MANENDTNWEETGYTEEQGSYEDIDESQEEYELEDSDIQSSNPDKKKQMAILLVLIIILAVIGLFLIVRIVSGGSANRMETPSAAPAVEVTDTQDLQSDLASSFFDESSDKTTDMMSVGFNDNGEATIVDNGAQDELVATVADVSQSDTLKSDDLFEAAVNDTSKQEAQANADKTNKQNEDKAKEDKKATKDKNTTGRANNSIMVAWNKAARQNPFKPPVVHQEYEDKYEQMDGIQFEIIEPPKRLVPDKNIEKLLQTQISGILYDEDSPSAIVNLAGRDEFVKIGDEISGYKIKNITRNKVEISYKNNTYVASVGELFVPGKLEAQPAVANLSNKFAGRYKQEDVEE